MTRSRVLRGILAVAAIVAYTVWDEALLSGPVVATAAWIGPWPAFLGFTVLYGSAGFVLTMLLVNAYRRRVGTGTSRLQRWIEREAEARRYLWARRALLNSGWPGFVLASWALGPIVTVWLLVASGRVRGEIGKAAGASSALFAVTFVGPYCGVGQLIRAL